MKKGTIRRFVQLREALIKEKAQIEARLNEINMALESTPGSVPPGSGKSRGRLRIQNPMSLKAAVLKATSETPLTKKEILAAVQKLGYRFAAENPMNSLNVVLYGKNPRFKNEQGRFSPAQPQSGSAGQSSSGSRRGRKSSA